jgi:hypothetical protein
VVEKRTASPWWRVLPRLLAEGQHGRFALIQEGRLVSVWDTYADAIQAGYDKFGIDAHILAVEITQRELDKLKRFYDGLPRTITLK